MILVFDLDDTLYNEMDFVKSGFEAVSNYLYEFYSIPKDESFKFMIETLLKNGRGRIFDDILIKFGLYSKKRVRKCVSVYRAHKPHIFLYNEADDCLKRFNDYFIYLVTDGNKLVQKNKIDALGLNNRVKFSFIIHRYGIKNSKPSPYCFLKICKMEKVEPEKVVYIGDNPNKDFVGIKPLGFKTIRVLTGQYKNVFKTDEFEADYPINNLSELSKDLLERIFTNN